MNLNHLAIFHAVAIEGSVSRGAERLHISQPAVSKQLRDFEGSLGVQLFDRHAKGVSITDAGVLLASYSLRLFALESEAELALTELRGLERGRLNVGASMTIGGYLLPEVLVRFHNRYPGIEITVEIANTEVIQHKLLDGVIDIGLTEGTAELPELEAEVFLEDDLVPIAAPDHAIFRTAPVSIAQLCEETFVMREHGSGTREVIERALAARGLKLRTSMSLGDIEAVKRAIAAGAGVGIVSALTIVGELKLGSIAVIPVSDFALRRPLHLLGRRDRYQPNAARAFSAILRG